MKYKLIISIIFMVCVFCSCRNTNDVDIKETLILVQEGENKVIEIDGDSLLITLSVVTPIFSEGESWKGGGRNVIVYDASIKLNNQTVNFITTSETDSKENRIFKDWNRLEKTVDGIKTYKSYQIGIADLYRENWINMPNHGKYLVKLLIR